MRLLQQQISNLNQNQTNSKHPKYLTHSSLMFTILNTPILQNIEIPRFGKYNGKKYPNNHLLVFTTLCRDFIFEDSLIVKLFSRSLKDMALDWFCSLSNNQLPPLHNSLMISSNTFK